MSAYKNFGWICFVLAIVAASAIPLADNDVLAEFLRKTQQSSPIKEKVVVKRRIFQDNADGELKQISLKSLIGDLENGLFASALSANKELTDKDGSVTEAKENNKSENQPLAKDVEDSVSTTTTESSTSLAVTDKTDSQTTEKVTPSSGGVPTHIVIDRIAIQPHTGGIAFIPVFELKRTGKDEDHNKSHEIAKITISKTEITSLATAPIETSTSAPNTQSSTSATTTSTTTEVPAETNTTPKNIEQLKEAEEELKEKVAEIEAEPIILSARV